MSKRHTYDLCPVLKSASRKAWRDVRRAHCENETIGEESLTDYILLRMKWMAKPGTLFIKKFPHIVESVVGADWEWWFISPAGAWGMRVQAKKRSLKPNGEPKYRAIEDRPEALTQATKLIRCAKLSSYPIPPV